KGRGDGLAWSPHRQRRGKARGRSGRDCQTNLAPGETGQGRFLRASALSATKSRLGRVLINRDCSAIAGCRERHVRCAEGSGDFLTASPPGEKAAARQDQAGQSCAHYGGWNWIGVREHRNVNSRRQTNYGYPTLARVRSVRSKWNRPC